MVRILVEENSSLHLFLKEIIKLSEEHEIDKALNVLNLAIDSGYIEHKVFVSLIVFVRHLFPDLYTQTPDLTGFMLESFDKSLKLLPNIPKPIIRSAELERRLQEIRDSLEKKEYLDMTRNVRRKGLDNLTFAVEGKILTSQISGIVNVMLTFTAVFLAVFIASRTMSHDYGIRVLVALPFGLLAAFAESWFFAKDLLNHNIKTADTPSQRERTILVSGNIHDNKISFETFNKELNERVIEAKDPVHGPKNSINITKLKKRKT